MPDSRVPLPLAFWLGFFALLMMHLGPLISGAQGVMDAPQVPIFSQSQHAEHSMAEHDGADHHAAMGHQTNPYLPEWVNNLQMCGYCELLTFTPALILALVFALALPAARVQSIGRVVAAVYASCLQSHATPRAPPVFA